MLAGEAERGASAGQLVRGLRLDVPILIGLFSLAGLGMVVLFSAGGEDPALLWRQAARLTMAFVVMLLIAQIPPRKLAAWAPWIYLGGVVLLLLVLLIGETGKGAQRWLSLGVVSFQPSELMKIATPMMIAWYLGDKPLPPSLGQIVIAGVMVGVPMVLIVRQPDLGTALLVGSAGFIAMFLAGLSWRLLAGIGILGVLLSVSVWLEWPVKVLHDYQRDRIETFFSPESDPLGTGYHIIQSKIAIGSGGVYGKGWLNGTQSQLEFLPERSTDFIFAVFGEEFGLMGALTLLALYMALVLRGLYIAATAQDCFSRLLAGSLSLTFFVYAFVNTGMVSGLLPVVGVPLPLVSYGGTSMVTLMAAFGILMSINSHRRFMSQ
ncbi:MAG: rod shape-determining protein RodA [Chromatiales bacterium]|jgi:rod shape determining protein RodA